MPNRQEIDALAAVDAIIEAFGRNDVAAYFAGFAEEATFVFHTSPQRLESRAEYESLWAQWQDDSGFEVVGCNSTERRIQLFDDVAIFTHSVETTVRIDGAEETQNERETIVMQNRAGAWTCIHEHLSGFD